MGYEYNHSIQFDLDHLTQYEDVSDLEEKKEELDHVYTQAPKADEYEAKAKAWDEGLEAVHDRLQHILHNTDTSKLLPGYIDGMYNALDIINDCYESGESE